MKSRTPEDVILDLSGMVDVGFSKNGWTLRSPEALQSQSLTKNLLKIGSFAMNMHRIFDQSSGGPEMPLFMTATAFHYALSAAPRMRDAPDDVIDILALEEQVALIERYFGHIDVDLDLVADLSRRAAASLQPDPSDLAERGE